MSNISCVSSLDIFFEGLIESLSRKSGFKTKPMVTSYIASLLQRYSKQSHPNELFNCEIRGRSLTIAELWLESLHFDTKKRIQVLKQIGDHALFVSGFFGDSIRNSIVDMDYYCAIGEKSYIEVAENKNISSSESALNVFFELASEFKNLTALLEQISDQCQLFGDKGILKIYKKWESTKAEHLYRLLKENGISPQPKIASGE